MAIFIVPHFLRRLRFRFLKQQDKTLRKKLLFHGKRLPNRLTGEAFPKPFRMRAATF